MQLVEKLVNVPKESSEVFDAIAFIIEQIKAKKEFAVIGAESLPLLFKAIDNFSQVNEESKSAEFYDGAALGTSRILKALLK